MIEFIQATNEDILSIHPQEAHGDPDEVQIGFSVFKEQLVPIEGRAIAIRCDGDCIGAYGVIELQAGVGWVWALFSRRLLAHHWLSLGRHVKLDLLKVEQMGFTRLEVTTRPSHVEGINYLHWLGFKMKKIMHGYFRDGEDALLYERACNVV